MLGQQTSSKEIWDGKHVEMLMQSRFIFIAETSTSSHLEEVPAHAPIEKKWNFLKHYGINIWKQYRIFQ